MERHVLDDSYNMLHHTWHAKANLPTKQASTLTPIWLSCEEEKECRCYISSPKARPQAIDPQKIMLARSDRLHLSADIERVTRTGVRTQTPIGAVYILTPSPAGRTRIACVVGKRVHSSAVVRHATQRKLRHACRALPNTPHGPYDMVVVASTAGIRTMNQKEIIDILSHAINRQTSS